MIISLRDQVPRGRRYAIQVVDHPSAWHYPMHGHEGFGDIVLIQSGSLLQQHGLDKIRMSRGDMLLVRPGDHHELWGEGVRFHNLNVLFGEWRRLAAYECDGLPLGLLESSRHQPRAHLGEGETKAATEDLDELLAAQVDIDAGLRLGRFLLRWLPLFVSRRTSCHRLSSQDWLEPLLDLIDKRLDQGIDVSDLPRIAGVSQAHLSRTFKHRLGISPSQHLNQLRLRRAAVALARTQRGILDICYGLGFRNPSYFYRLFTSNYGVPPATFRNRHTQPSRNTDIEH